MEKKHFFSPLLTMKEGLLKLNYCWMGRESWHAIKNHYNIPFLTLKVRYLAKLQGLVYYWVWL